VVPYLSLLPDITRRKHPLQEVFNGLCYIVKCPAAGRGFVLLPCR
jgi:hypothetical protein